MIHLVLFVFASRTYRELMSFTFDGLAREEHCQLNAAGYFSAYWKAFIGAFTVS